VGTESDCGYGSDMVSIAADFSILMDPIIVIAALIIITVEIYIRLL
jgi:hypothetical protein